mmetsp:Transcript_16585/g.19208  ORF Transcript_16585/g.19208 Transcript_16585/m.19208 type:complete len:639 (+) Transcript_16585:91-2007(+)
MMNRKMNLAYSIAFTCFALSIESYASLLRGFHHSNNDHQLLSEDPTSDMHGLPLTNANDTVARIVTNSYDSFDCLISEVDGMPEPGVEIEHQRWICEVQASETVEGKIYFYDKNPIEVFGEDNLISSMTIMSVPFDAVSDSIIESEHPDIVVRHDHSRRERRLNSVTGVHKLLIVRAIDTVNNNSPSYWKAQLRQFFFDDSANLKTYLRDCSGNQLNIIPATGPQVTNGMINIFINRSFQNQNWSTIGEWVNTELAKIPGLSYTTKAVVIPDGVNFESAAAWATMGGDTMWIQNQHCFKPAIQVHEYGHLLGERHSGKDNMSYADDTGFMGNKVPWTDEGVKMCFNAAKTWNFGWFTQYHKQINPNSSSLSIELVGIDDVVKNRAGQKKLVSKVIGDENTFYLMFNRKKGINGGVVGSRNKVVIVQQNGEGRDSIWRAALGHGDKWIYNNFGSTGKNLVVENCYIDYRNSDSLPDTAKVLIYIQGRDNLSCGSTPEPTCQDKPQWKDIAGDGCSWYGQNDSRCEQLGNTSGTNGFTANEACCVCEGGDITNDNGGNNNNSDGNTNNGGGNSGGNSNGSGSGGNTCTDEKGWNNKPWYDSGGSQFNCDWYQRNANACYFFGNKYKNMDMTANQACCACK